MQIKGPGMIADTFPPAFPLKHQQKDMRLALQLGCAPLYCLMTTCTGCTANNLIPAVPGMGHAQSTLSTTLSSLSPHFSSSASLNFP